MIVYCVSCLTLTGEDLKPGTMRTVLVVDDCDTCDMIREYEAENKKLPKMLR